MFDSEKNSIFNRRKLALYDIIKSVEGEKKLCEITAFA